MYESFYGLSAKPFKLIPDPGFYFGSKQHSRARAYLEYGVSRNEGFIVITGEIGAGKTTVLRSLIESLDGSNVVVGQLVTTQVDDQDVLRMVGAAFGVPVKDMSKALLLSNIEAFLITQATQGKRCLLVVDEAQNLSPRAVEELRMLSNFQLGNESLLQSFLVGQPEFRLILQQPDMEQFRQRVAATCHIGPLDESDVQAYVQHRLQAAGAAGKPSFDDDAYAELHRASGGVPRRINGLMDRLLLSGYLNETTHFSAQAVAEVARELAQETEPPRLVAAAVGEGSRRAASSPPAGHLIPVLRDVLQPGESLARLPAAAARGWAQRLGDAQSQDLADRLQRIEDAVLRLERQQQQHTDLMVELLSVLSQGGPADAASEGTAPLAEARPHPTPAGSGYLNTLEGQTTPEARTA